MTEKIRIIKALANPIGKRKAKKKRRKPGTARARRPRAARVIIRLVTKHKGFYRAEWWTGDSFSHQKAKAKRYPGNSARFVVRSTVFRAKLPRDYVVADILPV